MAVQFGRWLQAHVRSEGFVTAYADVAIDNKESLDLNRSLGGKVTGPAPASVQHMGRGKPMVRVRYDLARAS